MTTYTIELPDRCPRCKRNATAIAKDGGFFAELADCTPMQDFGPIPHRCPLLIIAGTGREHMKVFKVICLDCYQSENATRLEAYEQGQAVLDTLGASVRRRR